MRARTRNSTAPVPQRAPEPDIAGIPRAWRVSVVAKALSISAPTLYSLMKKGVVQHVHVPGGPLLITRDEIERLLTEYRVERKAS